MLNAGYIESTVDEVVIRVYYDATQPAGPGQPLVNGPRGWCLDMTNPSSKPVRVTFTRPDGAEQTISIGGGDPVTGGPVSGRSRTAAQMASLGFVTRGDVAAVNGPY